MSCIRRVRVLGLAVSVVIVVAAAVTAALASTPPGAKTVDYVRDLIDLYFQGQERDRFFDAAGVDGELTKAEFAAAAGKPNSFVRPYDRWPAASVFDSDRDARLDWVEAEQYRLAIRKRVLALFDKNGDGRLNGPEREAANAYLGAGMGQPSILRRPTTRPAPTSTRPSAPAWPGPVGVASPAGPSWPGRWNEAQARYDADKDGKLSGDERARMHQGLREHYRQSLLKRFDRNGDGQLDGDEQRAVEMERRVEAREWRRQWELTQWDADKDGRLSPNEQTAMEKHFAEQRRLARQRRQQWVARWDRNRDGKLSPEERAEATRDLRRRVVRQRKEMDANGDGKLTAKEIRAYRKKLFEELRGGP